MGDMDVPVVTEDKEWAAADEADSDDGVDNIDEHATEIFKAREKRLSVSAEEIEKELVMGDTDVPVVTEDKEWAGVDQLHGMSWMDKEWADSDNGVDHIDEHATETFQARERRLTVSAEEIDKQLAMGDADVPVVAEDKEWAGADEADSDDGVDNIDEHATKTFQAREKRLSVSAEEIEKELVMGDTDVPVVTENKEWAGADDADSDDGKCNADGHASEIFQAREKRLSLSTEELQKQQVIGDMDVPVVSQSKEWEWAGAEDVDDVDQFDHHASEIYKARERRLTICTEELEKEMVIGDVDVPIVSQGKEWAGDDEATEDNVEDPDLHPSTVFEARERRLTRGVEELEKVVLGDVDVPLMSQSAEWAGDEDVDDETPDNLDKHVIEVLEERERRWTRGAEELKKECVLGDKEVPVLTAGKEWAGAADVEKDDDDELVRPDEQASQAYEARERRLTRGAEELEKGLPIGDIAVDLVAEGKEWLSEESENEEGQDEMMQHAAEVFKKRERRLSAGAEIRQADLGEGQEDGPWLGRWEAAAYSQ